MADGVAKTCVICGADCSSKARTKDAKGRYYCKSCYEQAMLKPRAAVSSPSKATPAP